ncbi:hypothetical protein ACIGB8_17600 [Promicromonospora sukumoe]|uniref:hypothetical protein n=1 Tax=Promicromonospora sukumoe TaxID=88382 RepID=UPI0037C65AFE
MTGLYLSQFSNYLAAAPGADRVVEEIRDQLACDYEHWRDHWKPVKDALFRDRKGSRDGQELADIVAGAAARRQASYTQAAERWAQLTPLWDGLEYKRLSTQSVQVGDLTVKVPQLPAELRPDGTLEVLVVRFNQSALPLHVIYGALRIVQRAHPEATITFVDVPRLATYSSQDRDLTRFDEWLTQAGNDLAQLLGDGQDEAHAA